MSPPRFSAGAGLAPVEVPDTDAPLIGAGEWITVFTWASACTTGWCTPPVTDVGSDVGGRDVAAVGRVAPLEDTVLSGWMCLFLGG